MFKTSIFFALSLLIACNSQKNKVELIFDPNQPQQEWAISKLNNEINELGSSHNGSKIIVQTVENSTSPEGYALTIEENNVTITGNDANGTMYGILELAEQLRNSKSFSSVKENTESARFPFRAIKVNLPWDSYRRSEALQLHMETMQDILFWEKFLDMMAENRFNVLTLWNLHPFNYMIRPTNFPEACSFSDDELAKWQKFWNSLFKMAKDRGIDTYIVNWNIFVSPEFATNYKVAEYSKEGEFFTDGDTSEIVKQYTRECVTQVINEYPDLTGLGITLGEGMGAMTPKQREEWLLETIIEGARKADRKIKFIHRVPLSANKGSGGSTDKSVEVLTRETLDTLTCFDTPIWTELKFNWSHAFSSPKLVKVHGGPLTDTYWNPEPTNYKINWMMRNEDFFFLRWGQTDFIRQHIQENGHPYVGGYYVGSECYYPAVDYFTKSVEKPWDYAFERQWLFYKEWGRLLYNPNVPNEIFEQEFVYRYGESGIKLDKAWNLAGKVPLEIASFWNGTWDFTLYSEGFLALIDGKIGAQLIPLEKMIDRVPLEPSYLSIKEYVDIIHQGDFPDESKVTPIQLANQIEQSCLEAIKIASGISDRNNMALGNEIVDIKAWGYLGLYFAEKIRAGLAYYTYTVNGNIEGKNVAIQHLEKAAAHWKDLVTLTRPIYNEVPLVHLNNTENTNFHWARYQDDVDKEIEWLKGK